MLAWHGCGWDACVRACGGDGRENGKYRSNTNRNAAFIWKLENKTLWNWSVFVNSNAILAKDGSARLDASDSQRLLILLCMETPPCERVCACECI